MNQNPNPNPNSFLPPPSTNKDGIKKKKQTVKFNVPETDDDKKEASLPLYDVNNPTDVGIVRMVKGMGYKEDLKTREQMQKLRTLYNSSAGLNDDTIRAALDISTCKLSCSIL